MARTLMEPDTYAVVGASKVIRNDDGSTLRWFTREALEVGTEMPSQEVARGIYELRLAESRGWMGCRAVYLDFRFDSIHVAAERGNPSNDYGRTDLYVRGFWRDGKIVNDETYPKAPPLWKGECSGFACEIRVNHSASLCGYVSVPPDHPAYGKSYSDVDVDDVHGGLTWAHESDAGWEFGFDCAHYGDKGHPEWERGNRYGSFRDEGIYRDKEYVIAEIESLARQLRALAQ